MASTSSSVDRRCGKGICPDPVGDCGHVLPSQSIRSVASSGLDAGSGGVARRPNLIDLSPGMAGAAAKDMVLGRAGESRPGTECEGNGSFRVAFAFNGFHSNRRPGDGSHS